MGLFADIHACQACPLHQYMMCPPLTGFSKNLSPDIMMVGEATGLEECFIEKPFQGLTGKLLDKMLSSTSINRDNLYITNVVKCRPTGDGKKNRPPTKTEISICSGWLAKEITIVNPKIVITLGNVPTQLLLKNKKIKVGDLIGQKISFDNRIFVPMYHLSYLIQSGKSKIAEFIKIMERLKNEYSEYSW